MSTKLPTPWSGHERQTTEARQFLLGDLVEVEASIAAIGTDTGLAAETVVSNQQPVEAPVTAMVVPVEEAPMVAPLAPTSTQQPAGNTLDIEAIRRSIAAMPDTK